jgi:pyruvate,water dikinase
VIRPLKELWGRLFHPKPEPVSFTEIFDHFQELLRDHQQAMELIADLGEKSGGEYIFDRKYLVDLTGRLKTLLLRMVNGLNLITPRRYVELYATLDRIFLPLDAELRGRLSLSAEMPYVVPLTELPLDRPELTGGKANTLGRIIQSLHLPVPDGFVITTRAYRRFLEQNQLEDRILALLESWASGEMDERQVARQLQYGILGGVVPHDVAGAIKRQVEKTKGYWAVRSSAYGEDGEVSFAGVHETLLHVSPDDILPAYRKVLASLFSAGALSYRHTVGMLGEDAAMAVLCQETVTSVAAGVIHTLNVADPEANSLVIYASLGWGRPVVEGTGSADRYVVDRDPPHTIRTQEISPKTTMLGPKPGGGEEEIPVPLVEQNKPALSAEVAQTLVKWALLLERYFKRPQEVEWTLDGKGRCWVLQSRGLIFQKAQGSAREEVVEIGSRYPALIQNRGLVAHAGVGSGPVYHVDSDAKMNSMPEGAVLVIKYTAPWLARIVPRASAIIAERGTAAGHLATIAREFRVPTLVGVEGATEILREGMHLTVDTKQRVIYEGQVKELLQYELVRTLAFEEAPEFRLLRRLLKRIAPLHLIDPHSPEFSSEGCTSVHDVIRFIHEKAVEELMNLPSLLKRFRGIQVWTLVADLPLGLKILDLGGGIDPQARERRAMPGDIRSLPLLALWDGLSAPGVWSTEPVPVDFKGMISSLTKTRTETSAGAGSAGANLAVISDSYMNLHLHLGYHFNLIDARIEPDANRNHIYFRFVGGVTDMTRRSRRAQLLARILSRSDFKVDTKGDLVVARILHLPREDMQNQLRLLGRLIGFTRQLDIQLRSDEDVPHFVESFLREHLPLGATSLR